MSPSGVVFGILYRLEPDGMPQLRRKLIDRGLFLLLIEHFLQAPAYAERGRMGEALRVLFITDVIGFSIIVGPTLVTRMSPKRRLVVGLAKSVPERRSVSYGSHRAGATRESERDTGCPLTKPLDLRSAISALLDGVCRRGGCG